MSPWEPLRLPLFRAFWIASLASNFGTWIHEIGAGWLMAHLDPSPQMVAAVRTAMAIPIVLLAIPVGVIGDRFDRRRMLIVTQLLLCCTAATLATMTFSGVITSWMLLALTAVMGIGMVIHVPVWQAAVPELVPKVQLTRAVALGSISFNLARAVGPAVGGILIAAVGTWIAFALNAFSFAGIVVVLVSWKRQRRESTRGLSFRMSLYQGLRFVVNNAVMRNVLVGVVLFILPANALWSLLPLVAKAQLGWQAGGFGFLVGCVGFGALAAAWVLPRFHSQFGADRTIAGAMAAFAFGLAVLSVTTHAVWVGLATILMGSAWMITLTTLNATAQMTLPGRMRARGMGCFLTSMAFSMSAGSLLWGRVAEVTSLHVTQMCAAVVLLFTAAISLKFKIGDQLH
ncbi:enterobactin exporter EntS [Planctomycetes bacterium CA13]|uniref:Enterobactin exporter EntS n=2 Tax=Novipirellula herctigrandis TaxID=2527986 RepID=A0A5C5YWL0_9BACT|nr:enterobactin exporter EntS [Planctomycetes bacterium CA13]